MIPASELLTAEALNIASNERAVGFENAGPSADDEARIAELRKLAARQP